MSKNPVVHFEMPYEDAQRVTKFYEQAFGWKLNNWGEAMGNYLTAETGDTKDGRPTQPGTINGGLYPKSATTAQVPSVVISVDDIKTAIEAVKKAGGEILDEPVDIPGVGLYVSFKDTEDNRCSLLQSKPM